MIFLIIPFLFHYGKNKLQYEDFSFHYLENEKFAIYYQKGSSEIANFAYQIAEKTIAEYEEIFKYKLKRKIPIIIYNSQNQFKQTNIILDLIEEGVLGFAEIFKNRVVLPFNGSYKDFLYTLRHEIVHIFEYEYYLRRGLPLLAFSFEPPPPLWFMEGLSEYLSKRRSLNHPFIIADLMINERFIPLSQLPEESYLNYVLGEYFFIFLEERYSKNKVYQFIREVKKRKGIEGAVKRCFGKSFASLEKDFYEYLKEKYYPLIYKKRNFDKTCKIIVDHKKEKRNYNISPIAISENELVYLTYKEGKVSINCYSLKERKSKTILKDIDFLGKGEIHLLKPGITVFNDFLYFIKTVEEKVYLYKYNLKNKKSEKYYLDCEYAYSLRVSPDNKKLVFIGLKNGTSNLYLYDLEKKELSLLTYDIFEEKDPYFWGIDSLIFISDREKLGKYGIYLYSLKEKEIKKLYENEAEELSSVIPLNLDTILFLKEHNLIIYSLKENKILYQSDFLGNIKTPSIFDKKLYFAYYHNNGYSICQIDNLYDLLKEKSELKKEELKKEEEDFSYQKTAFKKEEKKYRFSLSPDYMQGQGYFSTGLGLRGDILIILSDLLGNHRFLILTNLYGLIDFSNFYFSYSYLKRREDYNLTLFQFVHFYPYKKDILITLTEKGIYPSVSYPFTKFLRSEFGFLFYLRDWRFYNREPFYEFEDKRVNEKFLYTFFSLIYDNALFASFGPIKGQRFLLMPYFTLPPSDSLFKSFYFETRNYFSLYNNSYIFALLLGSISSFGENKERFYPDGRFVRGYPYLYPPEDSTNSHLVFTKLELRYPFVEILKLGFPLPITIKNIRGNTFLDFGTNFKKSIIGIGFGLRFRMGYFPFMIDFAYPLSDKKRNWQITFGIKEDW